MERLSSHFDGVTKPELVYIEKCVDRFNRHSIGTAISASITIFSYQHSDPMLFTVTVERCEHHSSPLIEKSTRTVDLGWMNTDFYWNRKTKR